MISKLFLRPSLKKIGWFILSISLFCFFSCYYFTEVNLDANILAFITNDLSGTHYFKFIKNNLIDEILIVVSLLGFYFIVFSKEKKEDEFIEKLRLKAFYYSFLFNYLVLLVGVIFVYDFAFFWFVVFNIYTPIIVYLISFNCLLFKYNKVNEE